MASQLAIKEKMKRSDIVVWNDGSKLLLKQQVRRLHENVCGSWMRFRKQLIMPSKPTEETGAKPPSKEKKADTEKTSPPEGQEKSTGAAERVVDTEADYVQRDNAGTAGIADGATAAIAAIGVTVAVSMGESETESRMPPAIWLR
jgi:hypothetical protein